jgi:predicted glycosyltransferase
MRRIASNKSRAVLLSAGCATTIADRSGRRACQESSAHSRSFRRLDTVNASDNHVLRRPLTLPVRQPRIALYSHDTMGVGHVRRNLLIAQQLAALPCQADVLMIAGAREAGLFATGSGVDCVTLPALAKDERGNYGSRRFRLSLEETLAVRSQIIAAAVTSFRPHLLIVDKVPRGAGNELDETLRRVGETGETRCVLGLREVLDCPACVGREWRETDADAVIRRSYDEIWLYGDRAVFDPIAEYQFAPDIASRAVFTGYLDQSARLGEAAVSSSDRELLPSGPFALCVVGGGQDGHRLAETFLNAQLPSGWTGVVIGGPFMPQPMRESLRTATRSRRAMCYFDSVREADWFISRAERVVGMGGYNTICSILSFRKPALIVPRVSPRTEQLIRAEHLSRLGALDMLYPERATPAAITRWLAAPDVARPSTAIPIDLGGLDRIRERVGRLLSLPASRMSPRSVQHRSGCPLESRVSVEG